MNLTDVVSFCKQGMRMMPGIKSLSIVDARRMSNLGDFAPGTTVYKIDFRQWSGGISYKPGKSRAGDFYTVQAKVYIPRFRFETENIITELVDRKVVVFATDMNGENHRINYAEFSSEGDTGENATNSNGYVWTFTARDRRKRFFANYDAIPLTGNDNVLPDPETPQYSPVPPLPSVETGCCVTILTTPLPAEPLPSGNILNRNKFVRMVDGRQWYIDKNGLSIEIAGGGGTAYEQIIGTGATSYTITMDMTAFDTHTHVISRNGVILLRNAALSEISHFEISGQDITLAIPLESGEIIQIYKI